jgi:hypothetical protein
MDGWIAEISLEVWWGFASICAWQRVSLSRKTFGGKPCTIAVAFPR